MDTPPGVFQFTAVYLGGLTFGGLLWSAVLAIAGIQGSIENYSVQVFLISLVTGLVIQLTVFGLKKILFLRFYNPVTNADLLTLFDEAKRELGKGRRIELWSCNLERDIFLSSMNPLLRAILLSESAISRILENREKGKIVLAREMLMRERMTPASVVIVSVFYFTLFPWFILFNALLYLPIQLLSLIIVIVPIVLCLSVIYDPDSSRWTRHVDRILEEKYGTSPTAAIVEVLKGYSIANDVIEQQEREKREKAEGMPSRKRKALTESLFLAAMTSLVTFILLVRFLPDPLFLILFPILISFLLGFLAFMIAYMFIFMFPMVGRSSTKCTR